MNIKEAADAFVAAHRTDCIDVDTIERTYESVEQYLDWHGEGSDPERPWLRYVEISQFDHVDGHTELVEWEDDVDIILPRDQSGLDEWFNPDGNVTDEQVETCKARFYERVRTLILEECPHADVDIAHSGSLTRVSELFPIIQGMRETVLDESHKWADA